MTGQLARPLTAGAVDPMTTSAERSAPPIPTTSSPARADAASSDGTGCSAVVPMEIGTSDSARWATV
jgi:hypothetical protein